MLSALVLTCERYYSLCIKIQLFSSYFKAQFDEKVIILSRKSNNTKVKRK
jgi:hypothetical protein